MPLVLVLLAGAALADPCPNPVSLTELNVQLDEAEAAYADLDVGKFTIATDGFSLMLPCLAAPATAELAVRAHRLYALVQWGGDRQDDAHRSLAAIRRIDADAELPTSLVPSGHPLHGALVAASPGGTEPLDPPAEGVLLLDGVEGLSRPTGEPTLAQWQVDDSIRWSRLAKPTEVLPTYEIAAPTPMPTAAPVASSSAQPESVQSGRSPLRTPLLVTSAASAVVAGGMYGGAWAANRAFYGYEPPPGTSGADARQALEARQGTAGILTAGAASLALVAVGSGVTALVLK